MNTRSKIEVRVLAFGIAFALLVTALPTCAGSHESDLPAAARKALNASFPGGKIKDVERERERGAQYYGVDVAWQGRELEVEVTEDGVIGEIQEDVDVKTLPAAVASRMARIVDRNKVRKVERHEIRSIPCNGAFVQLAAPQIVYEIRARDSHGSKIEIRLNAVGKVFASEEDDENDEVTETGNNDDDNDEADDEQEGEHEDDDE